MNIDELLLNANLILNPIVGYFYPETDNPSLAEVKIKIQVVHPKFQNKQNILSFVTFLNLDTGSNVLGHINVENLIDYLSKNDLHFVPKCTDVFFNIIDDLPEKEAIIDGLCLEHNEDFTSAYGEKVDSQLKKLILNQILLGLNIKLNEQTGIGFSDY